jgi:polyisoprenoid-binding protein YceI
MNFKKVTLGLALGFLSTTALAKADKVKKVFAEEKLAVDTAATDLGWEGGKKLVPTKHVGKIQVKGGEILLAKGNIVGGTFEVDMATLTDTDLPSEKRQDLENHLKSDDFFDVEKYPLAKFEIKEVTALPKGDAKGTHLVKGTLTIKNVSKAISFPAHIEMGDGSVKARAEIEVDRTKFNIRYGSGKFFKKLGDKVIKDEFKLSLNLATKKG